MGRLARQFIAALRDAKGVAAVEYGIAAALMSAAIVTFMSDTNDPNGLMGRIKILMDSIFT